MRQTPAVSASPTGAARLGLGALPGPRQTAWSEGTERLRAAATTEPGRLRILGAVLALTIVAFGAVASWQVTERASAARDVTASSLRLASDAAEIYGSLADANSTEAGGFLAGGTEPAAVRERYESDVSKAAGLIAQAAASSQESAQSQSCNHVKGQSCIQLLATQLPVYTGLVETARADNRQGFPLGGAYLRYADEQMQKMLLPAAEQVYQVQEVRLKQDYSSAESLPWPSWALGLLALGGLIWAQRRTFRRTNRVFNPGMLGGTVASAAVLVWLVAGHTVALGVLDASGRHGVKSMGVLIEARIDSLKARGDENLALIARGTDDAHYEQNFQQEMTDLAGTGPGDTGLLGRALTLADDSGGRAPVRAAISDTAQWRAQHKTASTADTRGDYDTAVADVIGGTTFSSYQPPKTTEQSFDSVDTNLRMALEHEGDEITGASDAACDALAGLSEGAAALAVLGAAGAVLGIGRRLSEYR